MRTLGIDLSADPSETASCLITWRADGVQIDRPKVGRHNAALLEDMRSANWIAIDAPFGWPMDFVAAVGAFEATGRWPSDSYGLEDTADDQRRKSEAFRLRSTDIYVRDRIKARGRSVQPLSVSSNFLGVTAWRCAWLLGQFVGDEPLDRVGLNERTAASPRDRIVIEAYPAAALAAWDIDSKGYKARGRAAAQRAQDVRRVMLPSLVDAVSSWKHLALDTQKALLATDHALDALVASLVARAAALGETEQPTDWPKARQEGWIHLPKPGSLQRLRG